MNGAEIISGVSKSWWEEQNRLSLMQNGEWSERTKGISGRHIGYGVLDRYQKEGRAESIQYGDVQ